MKKLIATTSLASLLFSPSSMGETGFFLGTNFNYLNVASDVGTEITKNGYEADIKLLVSHYFDSAVVDLGAGWAFSKIKGDGFAPSREIQVITRSFLAELSPRYRLDRHWQLGPVIQFLAGDDVSYDENDQVNERKNHWRVGARLQYEFHDSPRYRVGLQAMTDLSIPNRQIASVGIDFQIGFTTEKPAPAAAPTPTVIVIEKPVFAQLANDKSIRIYLGEAMLSFKSGGSQLGAKAKEGLSKLAPILLRNQDAWNQMRVEGHSDSVIGKTDNQTLSERRAMAVKKELIRLQLPANKISSQGFAATRPIDPAENDEAYRLNRRVEIWLDDVKPDQIRTILAELNQLL